MTDPDDRQARIEDKAAEIAEMVVRGEGAFARLPQYMPMNRDAEFLVGWSEEDKKKLMGGYVAGAKLAAGGERFRNDAARQIVWRLIAEQRPVLRARYVPVTAEQMRARAAFPMKERKKLVQQRFAARFPDFVLDKSIVESRAGRSVPGALTYSRPLLENNKLWIAFELATGKTDGMFYTYIGVLEPFFSMRLASLFSSRHRNLFYTSKELALALDEDLDILEVLVPVFTEKMEQALQTHRPAVPRSASDLRRS